MQFTKRNPNATHAPAPTAGPDPTSPYPGTVHRAATWRELAGRSIGRWVHRAQGTPSRDAAGDSNSGRGAAHADSNSGRGAEGVRLFRRSEDRTALVAILLLTAANSWYVLFVL